MSKTTTEAITFYDGKIEDLNKNLADIERIVQGKGENVRVVEDGESFSNHLFVFAVSLGTSLRLVRPKREQGRMKAGPEVQA